MIQLETELNHEEKLGQIVQSNHYIRHRVQESVNEFLYMRENLLKQLEARNLNGLSNEFAPLLKAMDNTTLNKEVTSNKIQLALCGENSSGKTAFIHLLLGIENILPSDVGPVTARIVKLTYAKREQACAIIYPSLEASFQNKIDAQVDLAEFFRVNDEDDEPDWNGIADKLGPYVRRKEGIDIHSDEFAQWAKFFIEVRLPSPVLELGIDIYDTAGFRIRDARILKDCLYDLVRRVQPTIVFLYDNPSSTDETNDCFLALKDTLKHIYTSDIFFLNTKADIDKMTGVTKIKNVKQFIDFINNERIKRYNLLLKTPGMSNGIVGGLPKSFDKCHCFDICSVNSELMRPYGPIMNKNTIERLIQFVANSDLIIAQRVSNSVLPAIEAFFDLVLITSHRTQDQLEELVSDARQWIENYFREHREAFNKFLRDIFKKILHRFESMKDNLARRASQQKTLSNIKLFIQLAIKQEIMKSVVYDALGSMSKNILDLILSNQNLMINVTSNEMLISALRTDTNDQYETINDESKNVGILRYFMMQTITAPVLMVTDHLFNPENDDSGEYLLVHLDSQLGNNWMDSTNINSLQESQQYLNELQNQLTNSETMFDTTVLTWCTRLKTKIQKQISQQYEVALTVLPVRHQVHQILQQYAQQFIRIECQLQAAQDLAKFNGKKPTIRPNTQLDSSSTVYKIEEIEWGSIKKNLFVKTLTRPIVNRPSFSYIEAHYHRKITNLNIPNIVKLTYLFENRLSNGSYELWMIFESCSPGIKRTLQNYLDENYQQQTYVSLKKLFQIVFPIIDALVGLHENELLHRNLKPTNILIDEQDRIYLADLGDWSLPDDEQLDQIELRHQMSANSNGSYDDIKAFGQLGFLLCTIIDKKQRSTAIFNRFQQLIESSIKGLINITEIRHELNLLYEKLDHL